MVTLDFCVAVFGLFAGTCAAKSTNFFDRFLSIFLFAIAVGAILKLVTHGAG